MNKPIKYLTATAAIMLLSIVPVSAETGMQNKDLLCMSTASCEKLSHSIQAQIDELEKSDDPDYDKLDALQKQLLAAQDATILVQKAKTARQREIITEEKAKTQAAYVKVSEKLNAIEESLKEK